MLYFRSINHWMFKNNFLICCWIRALGLILLPTLRIWIYEREPLTMLVNILIAKIFILCSRKKKCFDLRLVSLLRVTNRDMNLMSINNDQHVLSLWPRHCLNLNLNFVYTEKTEKEINACSNKRVRRSEKYFQFCNFPLHSSNRFA